MIFSFPEYNSYRDFMAVSKQKPCPWAMPSDSVCLLPQIPGTVLYITICHRVEVKIAKCMSKILDTK